MNSLLRKIEGIVIRSIDYGESNKIITIYSQETGKIGLMARGAKKTNSRLSSISQLFTYGHFLYRSSKGLGTLTQGEIISSFRSIREDLFKTAYSAYIVELLDKLTEDKQPSASLFSLLYNTLHYINDDYDAEVLTFIFETKMLYVAGIAPQLDVCASCNQRRDRYLAFSVKEGGFLCSQCLQADRHSIKVSEATQKLLRLFMTLDLKRLGKISLKQETRAEIKEVLENYYETHSGLYLKSKRFLSQLDKFD